MIAGGYKISILPENINMDAGGCVAIYVFWNIGFYNEQFDFFHYDCK